MRIWLKYVTSMTGCLSLVKNVIVAVTVAHSWRGVHTADCGVRTIERGMSAIPLSAPRSAISRSALRSYSIVSATLAHRSVCVHPIFDSLGSVFRCAHMLCTFNDHYHILHSVQSSYTACMMQQCNTNQQCTILMDLCTVRLWIPQFFAAGGNLDPAAEF